MYECIYVRTCTKQLEVERVLSEAVSGGAGKHSIVQSCTHIYYSQCAGVYDPLFHCPLQVPLHTHTCRCTSIHTHTHTSISHQCVVIQLSISQFLADLYPAAIFIICQFHFRYKCCCTYMGEMEVCIGIFKPTLYNCSYLSRLAFSSDIRLNEYVNDVK